MQWLPHPRATAIGAEIKMGAGSQGMRRAGMREKRHVVGEEKSAQMAILWVRGGRGARSAGARQVSNNTKPKCAEIKRLPMPLGMQ